MRDLLRIIGLSFLTASFAFCFYLATQTYGQARFEQGHTKGAKDYHDFINKAIEKQQQDKCLKT